MIVKRFHRPFSLATRLTFFISLATIASFFAFAWIMIHSVKAHFAEQDISDLKEISTALERILNNPQESESRRLETLKNVVSGYSNIVILLEDGNQNALFHSPGALDLRQYITSATPDKNARQGNVYLFSTPALTTKAHSVTHNDQTNWRMIRLPVGQLPMVNPRIRFIWHYRSIFICTILTTLKINSL